MNRFKLMVLSATTAPSLSGRKIFSANCSTARFRTIWPDSFLRRRTCGSPYSSIFTPHAHDIGHTKCTFSKYIACLLLTGSLHICSFRRVRPRRLLFPTTIRRRIHSSSAGCPEKTHIFPQIHMRKRISESGTFISTWITRPEPWNPLKTPARPETKLRPPVP